MSRETINFNIIESRDHLNTQHSREGEKKSEAVLCPSKCYDFYKLFKLVVLVSNSKLKSMKKKISNNTKK